MTSPDRSPGPGPGRYPGAAQVAIDTSFAEPDLHRLRQEVSAHTAEVGDENLINRVLIVISELASNAIRHGGGGGRLRLWTEDRAIICQVVDHGRGITDIDPGARRPDPHSRGGRGIWLCRQLSDEFWLDTGTNGPTATARFDLGTVPLHPS